MVFSRNIYATLRKVLPLLFVFTTQQVFSQKEIIAETAGFARDIPSLVCFQLDGKTYYYHLEQQLQVDATSDYAGNMITVIKDGVYGVINSTDGKIIAPIEYDHIKLVAEYTGQWHPDIKYDYQFVITQKNGKYGIIDATGKIISDPQYDHIEVLNKKVIAFQKNQKWGWFSASDGKVARQPVYDHVSKTYFLTDEYLRISADKKEGIAKADGTVILPPTYTWIQYIKNPGQTFIAISENGKKGLADSTGKILIPPIYKDLIAADHKDLIICKNEAALYGVTDIKGSIVIPMQYTQLSGFIRGVSIVEQTGKKGVIDLRGNRVLPLQFDKIAITQADGKTKYAGTDAVISVPPVPKAIPGAAAGEAALKALNDEAALLPYIFITSQDNRPGVYDWKGKAVFPSAGYTRVEPFYYKNRVYFRVFNQSKFGILDSSGKQVLPVRYDLSYHDNYSYRQSDKLDAAGKQRFIVLATENKLGLFDLEKREIILPPVYNSIDWLSADHLLAKEPVQAAGYSTLKLLYDKNGQLLKTFPEDVIEVTVLTNKLLEVRTLDDQHTLTTLDGTTLYTWKPGRYFRSRFPHLSKDPHIFFHSGLKKIYGNEDNLFIDEKGAEKRFTAYPHVDVFYKGYALTAKEKTITRDGYERKELVFGLIDSTGKEIIPPELESLSAFYDIPDLLKVYKDGKTGIIDRSGKYIFPVAFEAINYEQGYQQVPVRKGGKLGLYDRDGKQILPVRYDEINFSYTGKSIWPALVKEGEWYYFINRDGRPYPLKAKQRKTF